MPANYEFASEFTFDINAYLIETYPLMSLADRRAICARAISEIDVETITDQIDCIVGGYAIDKLNFIDND